MNQICIIEDEAMIALHIKSYLEQNGFVVVGCVQTPEEAYALFEQDSPDIVISDIKLENGQSGIDIVKNLQSKYVFETIYLTSYTDDATMKKAFTTKPVSYIAKPFKEQNLYAAVMLCISKHEASNASTLEYNPQTEVLYKNGELLTLTMQESQLFDLLYTNKNVYVPKIIIQEYLWGSKSVAEVTLRGLIHRLGKKIGKELLDYSATYGCKLCV